MCERQHDLTPVRDPHEHGIPYLKSVNHSDEMSRMVLCGIGTRWGIGITETGKIRNDDAEMLSHQRCEALPHQRASQSMDEDERISRAGSRDMRMHSLNRHVVVGEDYFIVHSSRSRFISACGIACLPLPPFEARWRNASYSDTAQATETLRLCIIPT